MRTNCLILLLVIVLSASLALVACSDDDDDNQSGADDDDDATDDDAADDDVVDDDQADDDASPDDDDDTSDDDTSDDDTSDDDTSDDDHTTDDDDDTGGGEEIFYAPPPANSIGIFVSAAGGDDANPGTITAPVKTIGKGVQLAEAVHKAVFVAEGDYPEGFSSRASLFGGYRLPDWQRDPDAYPTSIQALKGTTVTLIGGSNQEPQILEGFQITGGDAFAIGSYSYDSTSGVELNGGEAIIAHNHITGGLAISSGFIAKVETAGIFINFAGSALIHGNVVTGNRAFFGYASEAYSYGILVCADRSIETRIENNQIGTLHSPGPQLLQGPPTGVEIHSGAVLLAGNSIKIGPSTVEDVTAVVVYDEGSMIAVNNLIMVKPTGGMLGQIMAISGPATLIDNTLINQSINKAWGIRMSSEVVLINNIIDLGPSIEATVLSFTDYDLPQIVLLNNDIYCTAGTENLIDGWDWTITDLDEMNQCQWAGCQEAAGNLAVNPGFISATDAHLAATSPCIGTGLDPSPWYAGPDVYLDYDGEARPQGAKWDIGFDEFVE